MFSNLLNFILICLQIKLLESQAKAERNKFKLLTQKINKLEEENELLAQRNVQLSKNIRNARAKTLAETSAKKDLQCRFDKERELRQRVQAANSAEIKAFKRKSKRKEATLNLIKEKTDEQRKQLRRHR